MKILIINPNTSRDFTDIIDSTAKEYASPRTEIITINPEKGPDILDTAEAQKEQIPRVADLIKRNLDNYDVFIIACAGDPGLELCREITPYVLGIGESAIWAACAITRNFSILTVIDLPDTWASERLCGLGLDPKLCRSARFIGTDPSTIVSKRHELRELYYEAGKKCIQVDGAEALILNCAGVSDLKKYLEERLQVPIIAGTIAAVKIAEQMPIRVK